MAVGLHDRLAIIVWRQENALTSNIQLLSFLKIDYKTSHFTYFVLVNSVASLKWRRFSFQKIKKRSRAHAGLNKLARRIFSCFSSYFLIALFFRQKNGCCSVLSSKICFICSGQIIATSHDRFPPNGGLVREMGPRLFQKKNLGW